MPKLLRPYPTQCLLAEASRHGIHFLPDGRIFRRQVIMAAGAFTMGASIELSADAPIREPFAVWMQGGITYTSGKLGVMLAAQEMTEAGLV